jgi:DNA-binding NarL/FixJ family response regulator
MLQAVAERSDSKRGAKSRSGRPFRLTERELEVISLLHRGLTNKQIARELSVTTITVKHHLSHIFCKLDVANRLQLALLASEHGLVGSPGPSALRDLQTQPAPSAWKKRNGTFGR